MPDLSIPTETTSSLKSSPVNNPIDHHHHNFTLSARRRRKLKAIKDAATSGEAAVLRQLALADGGLISDEMRKTIWPILLDLGYYKCLDLAKNDEDSAENFHDADDQTATDDERSSFCTCYSTSTQSSASTVDNLIIPNMDYQYQNGFLDQRSKNDSFFTSRTLKKLKKHPEYQQVELDVKRTLARFPPNVSDDKRISLQSRLTPLIVSVLASNKLYKYYQGFHDICLTVLLVFDDVPSTLKFCKHLARTYFKPQLTLTLEASCCDPLHLIYPLIYAVDKELFIFLENAEAGVHFAVSWSLTWFAHVVDDYPNLVRLYDFFLASHPLAPVYLIASVVLWRGQDLQKACPDGDMPMVHQYLSRWPVDAPLEALISDAQDLFAQYPPTVIHEKLTSKSSTLARRLAQEREKRRQNWALSRRHRKAGAVQVYRRALVWGVATAAAAYYLYNHYGNVLRMY